MKSPFALAHVGVGEARALRENVYVIDKDQFYELQTGSLLRRQSIDGRYAHEISGSPSSELLRSKLLRKVRRVDYIPGDRHRFTDGVLNTWTPGTVTPSPGPFPNVLELLQHLFPEEREREHVLKYLAFIFQNPGTKIAHALVIRGVPGSGKSTFLKLVRSGVGETNHKDAEGSQLLSRFRADLTNVQVLAVEEVAHGERIDVGEVTKTLITQRYIRVEEKFQPVASARTPDAILFVSNHHAPVPLDENDRRYWISKYIDSKPPQALFDSLYASLDVELPGFLHHLETLDLTGFDPNHPPPMTPAKAEMITESKPAAEVEITEWIETRRGCMKRDIVVPDHLLTQLRTAGYTNLTVTSVRRLLRAVGGVACANPLPPPKAGQTGWASECRVWAVRNHDHWRSASKAELREHMEGRDGQSPEHPGAPVP